MSMANAQYTRTPDPDPGNTVTGTCDQHGEHTVPAADAVLLHTRRVLVCPDEIRELTAA